MRAVGVGACGDLSFQTLHGMETSERWQIARTPGRTLASGGHTPHSPIEGCSFAGPGDFSLPVGSSDPSSFVDNTEQTVPRHAVLGGENHDPQTLSSVAFLGFPD